MISPGELFLGKYRILERLGEGGMGTVWRARDELLDRDVAIKELRADLAGQEALAERFRAEAVALARLAHPAIAALHGLERDAERWYMVMEFVPGDTLEAVVEREGPLRWDRAAALCAAVCDGLGHAHQQGVVHRDVKPANVMLTPGEQVKVMDFGIARMAGQARQTRHGSTIGTPHYMAPEQLRGEEVDGRADIYALGAVLFELISGRVPFDADSDYKLMMMQLHDAPPRASGAVPGVPGSIDRIIARAMAKDPSARYVTAGALREALLEAVQAGSPAAVPATASDSRAGGDAPLHRDWRTWATAVMVLTAGGLVLGGGSDTEGERLPAEADSGAIVATTMESPPPPSLDAPTTTGGGSSITPGGGRDAAVERVRGTSTPVSPPRQRTTPPATVAPAQEPPPPPPPPAAEDPPPDPRPAITRAVREWLGAMSRREPGGVAGQVAGRKLADLVREGRATVGGVGEPSISVDGNHATSTVSASVEIRSSFGATRTHPATFQVSLRENGGRWSVTSAKVQ